MTKLPAYGQRLLDEDGIYCHVCGRPFQKLAGHVIPAHGFTSAAEYRAEFGLSHKGLLSDQALARASKHAKEMGLVTLGAPTRVNGPHAGAIQSPEGRRLANANLVPGGGLEHAWESRRTRTHCKHGHPFDSGNTRIDPKTGARICRTCVKEESRRRRARVQRALKATRGPRKQT
jgi:ROS/MUCR transcriptional regulator protein